MDVMKTMMKSAMMAVLFLLTAGLASTALADLSFDDMMAISAQTRQTCASAGDDSLDCVVATHRLSEAQEQYARDQRNGEMDRMIQAQANPAPLTAAQRQHQQDARYLDAYDRGQASR
jgi:hypothetical protein